MKQDEPKRASPAHGSDAALCEAGQLAPSPDRLRADRCNPIHWRGAGVVMLTI